ncbi:CLUMA_CG004612, isoform A [Clunio marinus]|uniref:CLUMA_CG004612, isoform A n=1 Tax=Clunio marinus TaxID=568069 RepID=A0A1J1HSG2_9DIPT|nr:CLUMA_CG004612, isoform A [Clunio marinus]
MKVFTIALFITSFFAFNSVSQLLDPNSFFRGFLETSKNNFACGFPGVNVPSLDPFQLSSYSTSFGSVGGISNVQITVDNAAVTGLSNFNILAFDSNFLSLSITFLFNFPQLNINGMHTTSYDDSPFGGGNIENGAGTLLGSASNVQVGVTLGFSLFPFGLSSQNVNSVSVGSTSFTADGFSTAAKNTQFNNALSNGIPNWVANNLPSINSQLQAAFVDYANERLSGFFSVDSIINTMTSYVPPACN